MFNINIHIALNDLCMFLKEWAQNPLNAGLYSINTT